LSDDELGLGECAGELEPEAPRQPPHRKISVADICDQQVEAGVPCVVDDIGQERGAEPATLQIGADDERDFGRAGPHPGHGGKPQDLAAQVE
jgi:hypothetical protein